MGKEEKDNKTTRIMLFDGYAIAVDTNCYMATRQSSTNKKTGAVEYKTFGYYGSLEAALLAVKKEYAKKIIMDHNILTLDDAISIICRSNKRFEAEVQKAFEGVVA